MRVDVERASFEKQIVSGQKMSRRDHFLRKEQLREEQRLLRDVLSLLRNYGPLWYTEELDSRLAKAVAGKIHSVDRAAYVPASFCK
jgi:hypothetical protein